MKINLFEMWAAMGWPVRAVVIVLTLQALGSITVAFDRLMLLTLAKWRERKFARAVGPLVAEQDYGALLAHAREADGIHVARMVELALATFSARRAAGDTTERAATYARRAVDRRAETLNAELGRGMNVLASTGSTAPFVGLLGTVLGIISAFKLISAGGSGGIGTIGAAIGESLVVTGYGLVVAIPTVLLYNAVTYRLDLYEGAILRNVSELLDRLELGEWHAVVQSESVPVPRSARRDEKAA